MLTVKHISNSWIHAVTSVREVILNKKAAFLGTFSKSGCNGSQLITQNIDIPEFPVFLFTALVSTLPSPSFTAVNGNCYHQSSPAYHLVQCSEVQCSAVRCSAVQCSAVQCSAQGMFHAVQQIEYRNKTKPKWTDILGCSKLQHPPSETEGHISTLHSDNTDNIV